MQIEDGLAPPLSQTINTGAMPRFVEANLTEAGITEGCVIRVEYTMMAFEVQDKRLNRGSLPDVETLASRVTETVCHLLKF